jgi:hypothetical protein
VVQTLLIFVLLAVAVIFIFFKGTEYNPVYIDDILRPGKLLRDKQEE